ncbi:MAG TPA: hypothetical protein PLL26_00730 [Candidatus Dojkabacteria bacterium]|nr:hypothetical protein [Candidatus Dojkabacteria bacterium]
MRIRDLKLNRKDLLIIFTLCWFSFSSIIIATLFMFSHEFNWILLKDFVYVLLFIILFPSIISHRYDKNFVLFNLILWIIVVISFLQSPASIFLKMASIRQIMSFEIFFLIGYELIKNRLTYKKTVRIFLILGLVIVSFGIIEKSLKLWSFFDLSAYLGAKNIGFYENGYPYFFIEPIPEAISNLIGVTSVTRMVSTILDPINLGHILVLCVALSLKDNLKIFKFKVTNFFLIFVYIVGIFLTFSKGAWIQLFLVLVLKYNKFVRRYWILFFIILFLFLIGIGPFHPGLSIHIKGLTNSIKSATLWGLGLGMAGNYSSMFGNANSTIGDTYIGAIIGQIGVVGIVFWFLLIYSIYKKSVSENILGFVLFSQIFVAIFSENSFNILSIVFLFLLIGGLYRIQKEENKLEIKKNEKNNISWN